MARAVPERSELTISLVVYGPPRSGKSAVLRSLRDRVRRAGQGTDAAGSTLLDWLSLDLGAIGGWRVTVHVYAVPGQAQADATRRLVLAEADGILFVADAQASRLAENQVARRALRDNLLDRDGASRDVPVVFLHTKKDLPAELLLTPHALDEAMDARGGLTFATDTLRGIGVVEGFHSLLRQVLRRLAVAPEGE